jgi:hypothetical protein
VRKVEYLSPTSINLYGKNPEDFYIRYLSEFRPPRDKQTQPMAIGSAFDAYVKSYLHEKLFGKGIDPRFELQTLFENQVEPQHRDWAFETGQKAFDIYKQSGALADLLIELNSAVGQPRFEIEIRGTISVRDKGSVVLLGKPDIYFINQLGNSVILDWKVNGWFSQKGASPKKGYIRLRHGSGDRSRDKTHHKDCQPMIHQGMMINVALNLEDVDKDWATQLAIYGWLCGMDVGSDFIVGLDQLACSPDEVRIAEHRCRVGNTHQYTLFDNAVKLWDICNSDHFFRNRTKTDSKNLCEALDAKARAITEMLTSDKDEDKAFLAMTT